jgi:hypothetical protein
VSLAKDGAFTEQVKIHQTLINAPHRSPRRSTQPRKASSSDAQEHAALSGRSDGTQTPCTNSLGSGASLWWHASHASTLYFNQSCSSRRAVLAASIYFHRLHGAYYFNTKHISRILGTIYTPQKFAWCDLRLAIVEAVTQCRRLC